MRNIARTATKRIGIASLLFAALISLSGCNSTRGEEAPDARSSPTKQSRGVNRSRPAPELHQAKWNVRVARAGDRGKLSKKVKKRVAVQRPRLERAIRSLYDSLFLAATPPRKEIAARFTRPARRGFNRTLFGVPEDVRRVKTLRRFARIAIQVGSTRRASAAVTIKARGLRGSNVFRVQHHSRLWLARAEGAWRVIGFDARQQPLKKVDKR